MDTFLTIIAGVSVFVLGQFVIKFCIEPSIKFKELLADLSYQFLNNNTKIMNGSASEEMQKMLFSFSANLMKFRSSILGYKLVTPLLALPNFDSLLICSKKLNFIANSINQKPQASPEVQREIESAMQELESELRIRYLK